MITGQTSRFPEQIKTTTGDLGPGAYKTNKSTLKKSKYRGMAPFMSGAKKKSYVDDIVKQYSDRPPVGAYEEVNPVYIRGAQQKTAQFQSNTNRFADYKSNVPGPGEYFQPIQPVEVLQIRPKVIRNRPEDSIPSIPFETQRRVKTDLDDQRSQWISRAAGEQLQNPNPTQYNPYRTAELPPQVQIAVPIGGGGTSLARYKHESAWAKAPDRMKEVEDENVKLGPGTYSLETTLQQQKNAHSSFKNGTERFPETKTDGNIGPGTYAVSANQSIATVAAKQKNQADLKREMQKRLQEADEVVQQLRPTQQKKKEYDSTISPADRQRMENPAPGTYDTQQSPKGLSVDAQMKLALFSTFQVEKWHHTGASIPNKVICDEPEPERPPIEKPVMPGVLEKQVQRKIGDDFYQNPTGEIGPGAYSLEEKKVVQPQKQSAAFKSTYKRDDLYIHAEKHKSEQEAAIEQEKLVQEDRQEKRQVGGLETAVNFTLAKVQDNRNITFGTTMDRRTGLPIDPDMPSPGSYEIHQQKPRQTTLYKSERVNSYIPDLQRLPAVLQEGVGPSAERALNILAERKLEQCALGPGSYAGEVGYKIKKSFNAAAGK
ncbi:Conserved_hypothetical protein [Hexamita inflata]|uniref:Uncharacterized protein n=1 Tax=Hexamita inflata TaxID=28002 RepID=A0AA86ULP1_9EUKA|nr:Conserved hypothetical protein [Hexamita inflata]